MSIRIIGPQWECMAEKLRAEGWRIYVKSDSKRNIIEARR